MKNLLILLFFIPILGISQNIKIGKWKLEGVIIERINDNTQIEYKDKEITSFKIQWYSEKKYIICNNQELLKVSITNIYKDGYSGYVTNGKIKKYFRMYNYD